MGNVSLNFLFKNGYEPCVEAEVPAPEVVIEVVLPPVIEVVLPPVIDRPRREVHAPAWMRDFVS